VQTVQTVQTVPVMGLDGRRLVAAHQIVEHNPNAADAERENDTLEVKTGFLVEIEQAGRVPVFRDE
jgi:hypothetical protein